MASPASLGSPDDLFKIVCYILSTRSSAMIRETVGWLTPNQVHFGQTDAVHAARQVTLDRAFAEHPARFVNNAPVPVAKPTATWINRPTPKSVPECRPQS